MSSHVLPIRSPIERLVFYARRFFAITRFDIGLPRHCQTLPPFYLVPRTAQRSRLGSEDAFPTSALRFDDRHSFMAIALRSSRNQSSSSRLFVDSQFFSTGQVVERSTPGLACFYARAHFLFIIRCWQKSPLAFYVTECHGPLCDFAREKALFPKSYAGYS